MLKDDYHDIMLELASETVNGSDVDYVIGADTDIDPTDFDDQSGEGLVLSLVDMLTSSPEKTAEG